MAELRPEPTPKEAAPSAPAPKKPAEAAAPPAAPYTPPALRARRPVSEALLNEKWDHALSALAVRSALGLGAGVVFSVLLFRRRAWPAWVGLGFGAGRAWEEADASFRKGPDATGEHGRISRT